MVKVVKYVPGIDYNVYSQKLLNAAIKQGDVKAQFALGYLYYYGQSVNQSYSLAVKYLKMAAVRFLVSHFWLNVNWAHVM